ncbi:MAG: nuclear transport factor 2 family protein [Holophagaceae bacterium]
MNTYPTYVEEVNAITQVIDLYIDGARSGKSTLMKPAFHDDATIFGYVGNDLFGGPIKGLFDWNDANGPAKDIKTKICSIDVVGTCANVRVDSDNWTGHRFTDFFNLVKFDGKWKVVSKVFYLHS